VTEGDVIIWSSGLGKKKGPFTITVKRKKNVSKRELKMLQGDCESRGAHSQGERNGEMKWKVT